ncbi:sirohydrochlorin chelatase [Mycobacterium paraterrae]|uniref:Sirohydrochlorin chelatase n=1 Tax=Mycobacterium paraterrae TaxID=577492 RepID=A0ABY3VJ50_9MYCO|nr:CbiX/SirB N-terminal domain-containing protein [Mycobacterium paraterrae]UMB67532.1 sirohydrochlorin chelatase [Mycobacterium paraterrae]
MTTLLVAHGTRNPLGVRMIGDLAAAVADVLDEPVRVGFVDVLGPTPAEVLSTMRDEPTVVVPAFLSSGMHVRVDVPRYVAESGHERVTVTSPLGPSPELARALLCRLVGAGWQRDDHVVLVAAGTRDLRGHGELRYTAAALSALVGSRVSIAFAAPTRDGSGYPSVSEVVARARQSGARRIALSSYLLADGLFHSRLYDAGADVVAAPLGLHAAVIRLVCRRRREAVLTAPALVGVTS